MAAMQRSRAELSIRRGRLFEWGLLLAVLLAVVFWMGRQSRALEAQAELAAIQSTLGSLRTTLVIDHLHKAVRGQLENVATSQHNPFKILRAVPGNYAGEVAASEVASMRPGNWYFDPYCKCIGYRPLNPDWLEPESEMAVLWYRVEGAAGPLQITAQENYSWRGQLVN